MADVEWMEPPAEAFMSTRELVVKELKRNPGRWARVLKDRKSRAGANWWKDQGLEVVVAVSASAPDLLDVFARVSRPPAPAMRDGGGALPKPPSKPLVAQKVSRAPSQIQENSDESSSGQGDLTPDQITAQRRARLAAMRGGGRG